MIRKRDSSGKLRVLLEVDAGTELESHSRLECWMWHYIHACFAGPSLRLAAEASTISAELFGGLEQQDGKWKKHGVQVEVVINGNTQNTNAIPDLQFYLGPFTTSLRVVPLATFFTCSVLQEYVDKSFCMVSSYFVLFVLATLYMT